ncbi:MULTISPECIES: SDR family NAD(P)-dependent oxidoreductase [unclassified Salipiger]|uniref:SDR family NAD(P)-dependent oxidoreductase n=1 Tax=unclassified Salipiger TaxID=2640570 RepID=UPI0013B60446|nr:MULTISPECIES: SDR family oxidoreductase [unclassified Salipiger]NDV48649.1 SDR family oxidoreductase [Salipiger sp. PrR003]NDW30737.1 SDR family oxidoreductase [Salipiger sp. PrR007]
MTRKIALITGASRGLGRSAALHLARAGVEVIGTYNSSAEAAAETRRDIEALGVRAAMLPFDADGGDIAGFAATLAEELTRHFGRDTVDYLVNNAGLGVHASILGTEPEQLDLLYRVHLRTPFLLTRALSPRIAEGGAVLFVSSGLARFTLPGYAAYAAMKGAVEVLTRYAAQEFGPRGIRVNCLAPGAIATDFGGGAVRDNAELNARVAEMTALGRVGAPEDIGAGVAALLDGGLGWMSGQRVELSGGQGL